MKIVVDRGLCESNQVCVLFCPEVFRIDDNDKLIVATETPSEELRAQLEQAVVGCPRRALSIID